MSKKILASLALLATPLVTSMIARAENSQAQAFRQSLENFRGLHRTRTVESCVSLGYLATDFLNQSNKLSSEDVETISKKFKLESERLDCGAYRAAAAFLIESKAADAGLFQASEPKDLAEIEEAVQDADASPLVKAKFIGGVGRALGSAIGGAVVSKVIDAAVDAALPAMQVNGGVNQLADYAAVAHHAGIGYMGSWNVPARLEIGTPIPDKKVAIAETTKTGPVSDTEFDW